MIKSKRKKTVRRDSIHSPRKRHKFTDEDDAKLAVFVSQHSNLGLTPSSSKLWKLAEEEKLTQGRHTWQSMRSRFLKVIHPRLEGDRGQSDDGSDSQTPPRKHKNTPPSQDYFEVFESEGTLSDVLNQPPLKKAKLEQSYDLPHESVVMDGVVEDHQNSQKETVTGVINYLKAITNQPLSVVVHALIVNSGVVRDSLDYIQDPVGMFLVFSFLLCLKGSTKTNI